MNDVINLLSGYCEIYEELNNEGVVDNDLIMVNIWDIRAAVDTLRKLQAENGETK